MVEASAMRTRMNSASACAPVGPLSILGFGPENAPRAAEPATRSLNVVDPLTLTSANSSAWPLVRVCADAHRQLIH